MKRLVFPGGRRFAFTILDDTDVATVDNVAPVYDLLERLGMRTTKTVWPVACVEGSRNFSLSQTLEDPAYLAFVRGLHGRGFEVTWHGATMESSTRDRTVAGLERFRREFGFYPRIHANHSYNRENIYWGPDRLDDPLLRGLTRRFVRGPDGGYAGHLEGSPYWWGDLCGQHIRYVRNLTFGEINLLRINPSMPYHDEARPHVQLWFSATDAEDRVAFTDLLKPENQERLEREGGVCIVATHLGKGFVRDGAVDATVAGLLAQLAGRGGWFPPVGDLLDWLHARRGTDQLPAAEWRRMQWRWARDLVERKWRERTRRIAA